MAIPEIVCTVKGVERSVDPTDFGATWEMGLRPVATITIPDLRFDPWDLVTIAIDGVTEFAGFIQNPKEGGPLGDDTFFTTHDVTGREAYLDKRLVTASYAAGSTLAAIVADLHSTYLAPVGITLAAMGSTPVIGAVSFTDEWLSDVVAKLATASNWLQSITPAGAWTWKAAGAVSAPFDISDEDPADSDIEPETIGSEYANAVIVLGGDDKAAVRVEAKDNTEIAAHGRFDAVYQAAGITDAGALQALADGYLTIRKATRQEFSYQTLTPGLRPGQVQTITNTKRAISGSFLIRKVELRTPGGIPTYTVTVTSLIGPIASWADMYRQWSGGSSAALQIALGSGGAAGVATYPIGADGPLTSKSAVPGWTAHGKRAALDGTLFAGRVVVAKVWLKSRSGGGVTPRIYNRTTGEVVATGSAVALTDFPDSPQTIILSLAAGENVYELQLLPAVANEPVHGYGYVEAH